MTQLPQPTPQPLTAPQPMAAPRPMPAPMPMPAPAAVPMPAPQMAPPQPGQAMPGQMMPGQPMPGQMPMHAMPGQMPGQMPMPGQPPIGQPPMGQALGDAAPNYHSGLGAAPTAMTPGVAPAAPLPAVAEIEGGPGSDVGERALPQISIHAFCDRQETASCINEMTRDWRMKRTNTKIYMGGLQAAIDFYHKENTPSLIMIESGMRGQELFAQLDQLASVCDEGTKVVVIGAANDIRLYRQLMDKGVSEYIVPPLHPLNLIRTLSELYIDPDTPFTGRAIAFFGAKGGVGSSTLAHNIAWTLSEHLSQETSLIDLDSAWGTTALDFAYDSVSGLEEALSEPDRLDETLLDRIMIRHTPRLSLLPTASSLNTKPVMNAESFEAIVNGVRSISPLAILDMPHFWADWTTNLLTTVDDVVITATPDLANLRNTKNLIDFLKAQRPNDADPILILNKTGTCKNKEDEISVGDFGSAVGLEPSLVIGFDPDTFQKACNEGKMLTDMKAAAPILPGLEYIGHRLRTGQFGTPPSKAASGKGGKLPKLGKGSKAPKDADAAKEGSKSLFASLLRKKG